MAYKTPGLNDMSATMLRKIHKFTQHANYKSIFIGGIRDVIEEWGSVSGMLEEFELGDERPRDLTHLLELMGYETIHIMPDDEYDFNTPFKSNIEFDIAINMNSMAGKVSDQRTFFENYHVLVKKNQGVIVHSGCWLNGNDSAYYNYQPKFWATLAAQCHYNVIAHFAQSAKEIVRLENCSVEGTGGDLVSLYSSKFENKYRPVHVYTLYYPTAEEFDFKF